MYHRLTQVSRLNIHTHIYMKRYKKFLELDNKIYFNTRKNPFKTLETSSHYSLYFSVANGHDGRWPASYRGWSIIFYENICECIKPSLSSEKLVPFKLISYLYGEPIVMWEQKKVNQMIMQENL